MHRAPLAGALGLLLLATRWAAPAHAQGRPLDLEDFYRIETLGSPAISPDGRRVAYVRSITLEEENRTASEVWLVPADGSTPPARLTSPAFSASGPGWSPDGRLLHFTSTRRVPGTRSESNIWFLRMDQPAGEAFQIAGLGASPEWSPDGRWMAFTRATPPGPAPEPAWESDLHRRIESRFDGRMYDWMNYRFDQRGYLADPRDPHATPPRELYVVPAEGGAARQVTRMGVDVLGPAWRPDGSAFAVTADLHQRDEHSYEQADVFTVTLDGAVTQLTDDGFHYRNPAWSPDGRWIAVVGSEGLDVVIARRQKHGSPVDLYLFAADGGERRNLTAEFDHEAGAPTWSADGRWIHFSTGVQGATHLFRVSPRDGRVEQITRGNRRLGGISYSANRRVIAYTATDPAQPSDIYTALADGTPERRLTHGNRAWLEQVALSPAEQVLFRSRDGTPVEGWLLRPHDYDSTRTYPMILNIHGGPHSAFGYSFSYDFQLQAARGYFVLYTNPRGSTGYGEAFKWAIWNQWGGVDYEDILAGVDHVLARYPVDPARLGVTGTSYGGFMTNWIITQTPRFAAAVARASITNWVSDYGTADIPRTKESEFSGPPWEPQGLELLLKWSPIVHARGVTTPTLFLHGEYDHRVPIEEAEQMYLALRKQQVPAKFIRYPESYHGGWTPWRTVHAHFHRMRWFDQWLSSGDAPARAIPAKPSSVPSATPPE